MNYSFQTVCLLFVVTLVHIAVIVAISPMEEKASKLLSSIDVESIVENAIVKETSPAGVSRQESAEEKSLAEAGVISSDRQLPGFPDQLMQETQFRASPVEESEEPIAQTVSQEKAADRASVKSVESVALSQALRERVSAPTLISSKVAPTATPPVENKRQELTQPADQVAEMAPKARPVRAFRPIPKS